MAAEKAATRSFFIENQVDPSDEDEDKYSGEFKQHR
jgi:hypothetical protein